MPNPDVAELSADQYEVIGEKVSHRLALSPGAFVWLKYVRPVIMRPGHADAALLGRPSGVIESSRTDMSFIAGLAIDKFQWHVPLYRQHQRPIQAGFRVSRPWLTQLMSQTAQLLEPIHDAQLDSIRESRVVARDETPVKAGRAEPGS